jgi:hypothetical protein
MTQRVNRQWSIRYDYFIFPITIYLFSQYFCWTGLLEEKLSFKLFDNQHDKEAFFPRILCQHRGGSSDQTKVVVAKQLSLIRCPDVRFLCEISGPGSASSPREIFPDDSVKPSQAFPRSLGYGLKSRGFTLQWRE